MAYSDIKDPSAHFQTALYTGNSGTLAVTNDGNSNLQPDLVWTKKRSGTSHHALVDSSRGVSKQIYTNLTYQDDPVSGVTAFNTDGFTLGSNGTANLSGATFVGWQWKCNGGTTSTDTTSSITSTVQVNSDAGFSIVTYTGDGTTTGGFGHGLGVAPKVVFVKRRNTAADWCVYHKDMGAAYFVKLNTTDAQASGTWQALDPSSTTVIVYNGGLVNGNNDTYVAYCFAEKQGFSKFGKYVGNGSSNGPNIYTGFKPAFVMIKNASAVESWVIYDTKRNSYNLTDLKLSPDTADSENGNAGIGGAAYNNIDILSNGFKCVNNNAATNGSGNTLIYMAFAEHPFVAGGIPTTAR
jgi:hypothetical protein